MASYQITNFVLVTNQEEITIVVNPGSFAKFFGAKPQTVKYRGSGTVWNEVTTGRRPGTWMEGVIADLVAGHKIRVMPAL